MVCKDRELPPQEALPLENSDRALREALEN